MELKTKQKKAKLREYCDACGLPRSNVKGTSLTGWIFGKSCHCVSNQIVDDDPGQTALLDEAARTHIDDRYETLDVVGSGGMGTVYRVRDKTIDKIFALKVLRPELAGDKQAVVRFQQEIAAAKNLTHANLVAVYDCGLTPEGSPYFVMDYVVGLSLADLLQKEKESTGSATLGLQRCLDILLQACEALAHAHEHGIVHRDLKPSNILIRQDADGNDFVKVVDFGIAKILPPPGKDTVSLTRTAEIFGSPAYMSPEQCKGERVDRRCDIYAFGCVIFECLIGHPPFERENPVKTILAHIYDHPPSVRSRLVKFSAPDGVASVINRCLAKDPAERYDTVRSLVSDLERLRAGTDPLALTHKNKARRKRELKFLGFKYFPQTLSLLSMVLLALAVRDLPWLLALAELQQQHMFHSNRPREELANELVAMADDYNRPYALLMAAEADLKTGLPGEAAEKANGAIELFEAKKDLPDTLLAFRILFAQALRQGKFEDARQYGKEMNALINKGFDPAPKKGMRLLGFFYLPNFPAKLLDMQRMNVDSLLGFGDTEGALLLLDDAIFSLPKNRPTRDSINSELVLTLKKVEVLLALGRKTDAEALYEQLQQRSKKTGKELPANDMNKLATRFLGAGEIDLAQHAWSSVWQYGIYPYYQRNLALALCHTLKGEKSEAQILYDKAARSFLETTPCLTDFPTREIIMAGAAYGTKNQEAIDEFYTSFLDSIDRIGKDAPEPAFYDPDGSKKRNIRDGYVQVKLNVMIEYANTLSLTGQKVQAAMLRQQVETTLFEVAQPFNRDTYWHQLAIGYLLDKDYQSASRLMGLWYNTSQPGIGGDAAPSLSKLQYACTLALDTHPKRAEMLLQEVINNEAAAGSIEAALLKAKAHTALGNIKLARNDLNGAKFQYQHSQYALHNPMVIEQNLDVYNRIQLSKVLAKQNRLLDAAKLFNDGTVNAQSGYFQIRALESYSDFLNLKGSPAEAAQAANRARRLSELDTTSDTMRKTMEALRYRVEINDFIVVDKQQ